MAFRLIPMDEGHLPAVAALERACFSHPWTEAMLLEELRGEAALYLVAAGEDGTVLGYAGMRAVAGEGYLHNVAVAASARRQGVADALIGALCRHGRAGLAFLTLEVRASNAAAVALYEKHGFAVVGRRKNYYDAPRQDALLMTLEFT
ncbi:MAG: ribosomal protein S18-alanine N-acetyltransferase [Clostridiales bacterium]|nr:ribosomal protein S18-alanine N-acetyltransferase [Clostridiales bacterium]